MRHTLLQVKPCLLSAVHVYVHNAFVLGQSVIQKETEMQQNLNRGRHFAAEHLVFINL
jgi:hypothetical protein